MLYSRCHYRNNIHSKPYTYRLKDYTEGTLLTSDVKTSL